jgi:flagellar biogenesis protein FliO
MIHTLLLAEIEGSTLIGSERWSGGSSIGLILFTLILFSGLALLAWYLNGRGTTTRRVSGSNLEIFETRSLGGRQFLMVVGYGGERFLLSVCPGRVEYLCSLPETGRADGEVPLDAESSKGRFVKLLQNVSKGRA